MSDTLSITLNQEQTRFFRDRAENQTAHLASPIQPADLVALAVRFYQERPDLVEMYYSWEGSPPCIWPRRPHELQHYDAQYYDASTGLYSC